MTYADFTVALSRLHVRVSNPDTLTVVCDGTASAIKLGLTAYDGAYVDLAPQAGVPLTTLDARMRDADAAAALPSSCLEEKGTIGRCGTDERTPKFSAPPLWGCFVPELPGP